MPKRIIIDTDPVRRR
ncbi:TPA_exp: hypothetical protein A8136_6451 [Trichophyton benhamiae CBS 112371]|nr:TPA_exp: hypothetical protein A8136_6451 [Trichophyton benhamiae CBS 112371]